MRSITLKLLDEQADGLARIDASALSLDALSRLSVSEIAHRTLLAPSGPVRLEKLFSIEIQEHAMSSVAEDRLVLRGNLSRFENLCAETRTGTTIIAGNVGDDFARTQYGGRIFVEGSVGRRAFADKRDGICFVGQDTGDRFGGPLPGKLQGIQGGDCFVLGNLGDRACERMRRGIVCIAGDVGDYLAHQWIAGTILALQSLGPHWATHMRRGSLILASRPVARSGASLSKERLLELSFLPILWKYLRDLLTSIVQEQLPVGSLTHKFQEILGRIPTGRNVLRCIGDIECQGQGEVLLMQD
jgi:formylmethanofuran dehydrogenase subunit C